MADCTNVEIRELLPERAGGALSVADSARVDAHLASCELCSSELALIQNARRALRFSPSIDVGRITAGVIAATAAPSRPQLVGSGARNATVRRRPALRWVGWKAAAAIAIAAAGAGSFAVWSSANEPATPPNAVAAATSPIPATGTSSLPSTAPQSAVLVASSASTGPAELGVAGGLIDLSDGDLEALLGDFGLSNAETIADASFEEPAVIVPSVGSALDGGGESL